MTLQEALNDTFRVNYFADYLSNLSAAIYQDNVKIAGIRVSPLNSVNLLCLIFRLLCVVIDG